MPDKAFNERMNTSASVFSRNPNDFITDMFNRKNAHMANTFRVVQKEQPKYRNFQYEYQALKFIDDNRNDIYRGTEDPREAMYSDYLGDLVAKLFPELPTDFVKKNARTLIKDVAGDDMSASNIFEVVGKKVQEGFANALLGAKLYFQNFSGVFEESSNMPDEIKQKHRDEFKQAVDLAKSKAVRTDYYDNDFTSFAEKMFLSAADFVPYMVMSWAPSAVGAVLTRITNLPFFYTIGKGLSGAMAGLIEAGSITTDLISAGADAKLTNKIASSVGIINGLLEYAGDYPERKITEKVLELKKLNKAVNGLDTNITRGLVRDVLASAGIDYATGLVFEPTTEMAQEFVSMYAMNLASKWQKMNTGKSFEKEFTYTPQQMADALKEVGLSTLRGQLLIGAGFGGLEMFKGIRQINKARQFTRQTDGSYMADVESILRKDGKVDVQETGKGVPENPFEPINARGTSIGVIPNTEKEADIAGYVYRKGKNNSMYINLDKSEVKGTKATREQYLNLVDALLDKDINGNDIKVAYTEDGKLKVADSQVAELITTLISGNYDKYQGITEETVENGRQFNVTFDGTTFTFTTQDSVSGEEITNSVLLSQKDAKINEALEKMAEKNKKIAEDRQKALAKGVDEYLAKPLEERRNEFIRDARNTFIRQGYTGDELNKQVSATKELLAKNQSILDKANDEIKKSGILKRGVSAESFTTSINNGLVGTIATLAKRFGTDMTLAKDHVVFDAGIREGISVTSDKGSVRVDKTYGDSYWTDGTVDENGKLKHIKNYGDIADKSKAMFHVAITNLVDQTTAVHEAGHMFVSMGEASLMKDSDFRKAFKDALRKDNTIKDKNGKKVIKAESEWVLGDATHEAFCEKLETYVNTGLADNVEQARIFRSVLAAMRDIWKSIKEFLTKDQQAFFDKLFDASNNAVYNEQYSVNEETEEAETETERSKAESITVDDRKQVDIILDDIRNNPDKYRDTDGKLLAPNGSVSNFNNYENGEYLYALVRTENFKKWFGDWENDPDNSSKVVDENGEPLVVSHFTNELFDTFKVGNGNNYGNGIYFADNSSEYSKYGNNQIKSFVSIVRPINADDDAIIDKSQIDIITQKVQEYVENGFANIVKTNKKILGGLTVEGLKQKISSIHERLYSRPYLYGDALYFYQNSIANYVDYYEDGGRELYDRVSRDIANIFTEITGYDGVFIPEESWYVALQPNQVKSVDNNGNFSIDDNRFRYKRETEVAYVEKLLAEGGILLYEETNRYREQSEWVKADDNARRIIVDCSIQWVSNLYRKVLKDYLGDRKFNYKSITDEEWKIIADNWKKEIDDELKSRTAGEKRKAEAKLTTDVDAVKIAKRMSVLLGLKKNDNSVITWLNQFTGKNGSYGDQNISALARKLRDTTDLLDEKADMNGMMLSVNFPYLDWVLQYNEKSKHNTRRNKGTNAIFDGAEKEIEKNAERLYQIDQGNVYEVTEETEDTVENDITEGEYKNYKVGRIKKLVDELRKAKEESARNRTAWVNLSDVNERLTGEFYSRYQKLQELSEKNGIKRDSWETFDDLVDRIEESDEALKAVNEELGKEYLETTLKNMQTIEENNLKIQELASQLESDEDVIQNQKTSLRNKDREIRDYINMIEKLADELEQASIREALGDSLLLSQYKDYEKKVSTLQKELGKLQKKYDDLFFEYADEETGARFLKELLRDADKKLESLRNKYASAEKMAGNVISKTHVQANEDAPLSRKIELIGMKLTRTMRALNRKVDEYYRLDKRYQVARERYETIRAQRMVENSKRKWRRKLEAKSGDADRRRAMREFSKAFFQVPNEARPWKNLYLGELMKEAIPRTIDILRKLGFIQTDKDGQTVLAKGFNDLQVDSKLFKDIYTAIRGDVESTVDLKKSRDEDMASRYTQLVPQFVEQMAEKKLSRKLEAQAREMVADKKFKTLEDARLSIINERVGKLHEGSEAYRKELRKLGYNRFNVHNLTAFASFESLWNLAGKISPKLRDALFFEFEYNKFAGVDEAGIPQYKKEKVYGLNHITNKSIEGKRQRINEMHEKVLTELGLWTKDEKTNQKNWAEFVKQMNERQETGQTFDIPRRLQEDERFMHMAFEYDKDGNIAVDEDGSFVLKIPYDSNYSDDSYNLQEVLAIYVHSKNAESFPHLFNDRSSLTPWQMAYIVNEVENDGGKFHKWQKVADIIQEEYEKKFEEISDKSNLVNNKSLKKVDVYLPFNAASDSRDIDISLDTQFGEQEYTGSADVGAGTPAFTLERQGGNNPINLDFVSEFDRVVGAQEYFINGAEFFKTWNEILSSKGGKLKLQIQNVFGMNQANTFVKNLQMCKDIVTSSPEDGMNRIVNTLRNNMALANLGFNVSSIIQQPFVWFLGASRFGYARMIKAMSAYRQYDSIKAWKEHLYELAPQIRETTNMQLGYAHEAVENSKALKGLKKVAELGMKGIEMFDEITRLVMFQAGMDYYSSLETEVDGKMTNTYTQEQAAERAIQDVMNMNSSRQAKDNALIYNSKSPYWKALLMFTNQLNKQWNMLLGEDGLQALFEGNWKKTIGTLLGLGLATSGVLLAKGKLLNNGSGDDDEWWEDLLKDLATESVEMIPVIGDEISSAINGYSYMDSNIVSSTINFGKRIAETISEPTKKNKRKTVTATKNMAVDFLTLIGAPKYPFQHTYNALFEKGKFVGDSFFNDLNGVSRVLLPTEWYEYLTKELFND